MAELDRTATHDAPSRITTAPAVDADVEVSEPRSAEHDAPVAQELDAQTRARRDAALARVRKLGDPALRASALPVERFDEELQAQIARMGELMVDALGIGLAATQVGVLNRVLVYRVHPEDTITALVNPALEWTSEELESAEEGCLSLPGAHVEVERPARVRARARNGSGEELLIEAEGLHARVIQHEIDHLDGILILDRISREARKQAMRAMREGEAVEERSEHAREAAAPNGGAAEERPSHAPEGAAGEGEAAEDSMDARAHEPDPNATLA
jgi:peptide deformylase